MGKTAFTLMIITLISKVTGLVREQFFAYFLGSEFAQFSSGRPLSLQSYSSTAHRELWGQFWGECS